MHGSHLKLPNGRGRSPQVWSIISGATTYYAHIFKYSKNADEGEILFVKKIDITIFDTPATLQHKSQLIFNQFLFENKNSLEHTLLQTSSQNDEETSWFEKRTPADGLIDWKTVVQIADLIRAQTRPYPGAFSFLSGFRMNIWSANVFDTKLQLSNKQAVIVDVLDDKSFIVQCNGGF